MERHKDWTRAVSPPPQGQDFLVDWAQVGLVGVDLDEDVSGRQTLRLGARANIDRCLAQQLRYRADLHLDPG